MWDFFSKLAYTPYWVCRIPKGSLDRIFGKHNEDCYSNLGSTFRTIRVFYLKFLPSTLSDEVVQDEEEAESYSQSIWIEEILLGVTPSLAAPEVSEISDISSPHMADPEEDICISIFLWKNLLPFFAKIQVSVFSILNFVHSLSVIVSKNEEEFDLSLSNDVDGVHKS